MKRITTHGGPDLSNGELLDPLVCLKIIYEFADCSLGHLFWPMIRH